MAPFAGPPTSPARDRALRQAVCDDKSRACNQAWQSRDAQTPNVVDHRPAGGQYCLSPNVPPQQRRQRVGRGSPRGCDECRRIPAPESVMQLFRKSVCGPLRVATFGVRGRAMHRRRSDFTQRIRSSASGRSRSEALWRRRWPSFRELHQLPEPTSTEFSAGSGWSEALNALECEPAGSWCSDPPR